MNILSAIYLQVRRNKINSTEFADFDHLKKYILKEAIEYTTNSALEANREVSDLAEIQEVKKDFRFDGEDFLGQIETLNFYFKEKDTEYRKPLDEFEKKCSVFSYFKFQSKAG